MIKRVIRSIARKVCANNEVWVSLPSWMKAQDFVRVQRAIVLEESFAKRCEDVFKESAVLSGPFQDLLVPQITTQGCAALPRLVGSYESELHNTVEKLILKNHLLIIDIGFAEGYYLIGLGKRLRQAKLVGFDGSPEAHKLCSNTAKANNIHPNRVELLGKCEIDSLNKYLPARSIVICDCEGFEQELFTEAQKELWKNSDLIVECHDFISPGAEESVRAALEKTHRVHIIQSVKANEKLSLLSSPTFAKFNLEEKLRVLEEGRPCSQNWLVAETLNGADKF